MIERLQKELKKDKNYFYAWQSNIAMAFIDEFRREAKRGPSYKELHKIANNAAKNFLNDLLRG